MNLRILGPVLIAVAAYLPAAAPDPLPTVPSVDLRRYLGTWHEIARYPNRFQKGCEQATAHYSLLPDGTLEVRNSCLNKDGSVRSVLGQAYVADSATYAKLKVSFVPGWLRWSGVGWGDYWIVELDPDYRYAVVSEPQRKYLWILYREAAMPRALYDSLLTRLRQLGLDPERLIASGAATVKP